MRTIAEYGAGRHPLHFRGFACAVCDNGQTCGGVNRLGVLAALQASERARKLLVLGDTEYYLSVCIHWSMRLLAFGDSLTAGYHNTGNGFAPWAPLLRDLVGAEVCDHVGFSGFTSEQLVDCMEDESTEDVVPLAWPGLKYKLKHSGPYGVVLIMCGTNDLAAQIPAYMIVQNLKRLHAACHACGAKTVAMSIPESHAAVKVEWLNAARKEANAAIRAWATSAGSQVHFVDVSSLVPFRQEAVVAGLWEPDGLHFSPKGYAAFGRGLAPLVKEFIAAATAGAGCGGGSGSGSGGGGAPAQHDAASHTSACLTSLAGLPGTALRVTLTPKLLAKPLSAALLTPYLGGVGKKLASRLALANAAAPTLADVVRVTVDGAAVMDVSAPAAASLPSAAHEVQLVLCEGAAGALAAALQ